MNNVKIEDHMTDLDKLVSFNVDGVEYTMITRVYENGERGVAVAFRGYLLSIITDEKFPFVHVGQPGASFSDKGPDLGYVHPGGKYDIKDYSFRAVSGGGISGVLDAAGAHKMAQIWEDVAETISYFNAFVKADEVAEALGAAKKGE